MQTKCLKLRKCSILFVLTHLFSQWSQICRQWHKLITFLKNVVGWRPRPQIAIWKARQRHYFRVLWVVTSHEPNTFGVLAMHHIVSYSWIAVVSVVSRIIKETMVYCVAYNCKNGSGSGASFFTFPSEPRRRKKWIEAVRRKNWQPGQYSRLCQKYPGNHIYQLDHFKIKFTVEMYRNM